MIELLLQAERALAVGLVDHAERLYRQAIAADPRNSIAVVGLARVALERADDVEAYHLAKRALGIDPENVAALRLTGRLEEVYAHRGETLPGVDDGRAISAPVNSAPVVAQAGPPAAPVAANAVPVAPTGHLTAEPAIEPAAPAIAPPAPAIEPAAALATPAIPAIQAAPAIQPPTAAPVPAAAVPAAAVPATGAALEPAAAPAVTPPPTERPTAQVKAPVRTPAPVPGPPAPVHRSFLDRLLRRNRP